MNYQKFWTIKGRRANFDSLLPRCNLTNVFKSLPIAPGSSPLVSKGAVIDWRIYHRPSFASTPNYSIPNFKIVTI